MAYDVFLDDLYIYGVTDVQEAGALDINEYEGIGSGTYALPGSKELRKWTVKCELTNNNDRRFDDWTEAREVFERLNAMQEGEPVRLVISTDNDQTSELVLLESYDKQERDYAGVYDVSLSLIEYKKVGVRTTDVPYVARPGKVPIPPTVVFDGKGSTPYSVVAAWKDRGAALRPSPFYDHRTGRPYDNPCTIPNGVEVSIKSADSVKFVPHRQPTNAMEGVAYAAVDWAEKTWSAISDSITNFSKDQQEKWDKETQDRLQQANRK